MMGCPCNQQLLGALMGDVSGRPVHIEAPFSLGVELYNDSPWYSGSYGVASPEQIAQALNESDYTSGVTAYELAGVIHPFIVVEGYSAQEYGRDGDLRNAILGVINGLPNTGIDYGSVRFEVETYDPATGQTQTTRYDAPSGGSASAPPGSQGPGFFDQLSVDLGIGTQGAMWLIIGGAVLAVALIAKR